MRGNAAIRATGASRRRCRDARWELRWRPRSWLPPELHPWHLKRRNCCDKMEWERCRGQQKLLDGTRNQSEPSTSLASNRRWVCLALARDGSTLSWLWKVQHLVECNSAWKRPTLAIFLSLYYKSGHVALSTFDWALIFLLRFSQDDTQLPLRWWYGLCVCDTTTTSRRI